MTNIEFAENKESRIPVVLCLDTSASMNGDSINLLNEAVQTFIADVKFDTQASLAVDLCVLTFNYQVDVIQDFTSILEIENIPNMRAYGNTLLYECIDLALNKLEERKIEYRINNIGYYQPWLVILTDGYPTSDEQVREKVISRFSSYKKSIISYPIGIGEDVDFKELSNLTTTDVYNIKNVNFKELFLWLSASVKQVSMQATLDIDDNLQLPPIGWSEI